MRYLKACLRNHETVILKDFTSLSSFDIHWHAISGTLIFLIVSFVTLLSHLPTYKSTDLTALLSIPVTVFCPLITSLLRFTVFQSEGIRTIIYKAEVAHRYRSTITGRNRNSSHSLCRMFPSRVMLINFWQHI